MRQMGVGHILVKRILSKNRGSGEQESTAEDDRHDRRHAQAQERPDNPIRVAAGTENGPHRHLKQYTEPEERG